MPDFASKQYHSLQIKNLNFTRKPEGGDREISVI